MTIKRYSVWTARVNGEIQDAPCSVEDSNGEWVKWEDYEKLEKELEEERRFKLSDLHHYLGKRKEKPDEFAYGGSFFVIDDNGVKARVWTKRETGPWFEMEIPSRQLKVFSGYVKDDN